MDKDNAPADAVKIVQKAVEALQDAIDGVEIPFEEANIVGDIDNVAAWGGFDQSDETVDPLTRQAEIVIAASRRLLTVMAGELQGRGVAAGKTCFKSLPPADMHHIEGRRGVFWVCDHDPPHRSD